MRAAVLALVCGIALLAVARADDDPTVSLSGITDLDVENFDQLVNGRRHALVEFYAPWCGHCKRMTPEFKKLGAKIAGDAGLSSRVIVGKVDADKHRPLGERFDVKGFPTILFFSRGKPVEKFSVYQGPRGYDGFLKFIEEQLEADKGFARSSGLDSLATQFLDAVEDARSGIVEQISAAAGALTGDDKSAGDLYARYAKKAIEKGSDYFQSEYERLERILSNGNVSPAKLQEVARKSSVLTAFIPSLNVKPAQEAEAEEAEADEE